MSRYPNVYALGHLMTFEEVHGLCSKSYDNLNVGQRLQGEGATWTVENEWEDGGFAAYKIRKAGGWTAMVFRGTDDWRDWVFNNLANAMGSGHPPQYRSGSRIVASHGQGAILVGHSLGGGIATYASAIHGNPAVTVFPAPVIPASLPRGGSNADVVNYVCRGEALTELTAGGRRSSGWRNFAQDVVDAAVSGTVHRRLGIDHWVQSNGGSAIDKHSLQKIAM